MEQLIKLTCTKCGNPEAIFHHPYQRWGNSGNIICHKCGAVFTVKYHGTNNISIGRFVYFSETMKSKEGVKKQ